MDGVNVIRTVLLSLPAVTALVGPRVYTGIWPQTLTLPAVLVQAVAKIEPGQLRGSGGQLAQRVQVDAKATTRAEAVDVMAAVHGDGAGSGLAFYRGTVTVNGSSVPVQMGLPITEAEDFTAGERDEFRVMHDYRVHLPR